MGVVQEAEIWWVDGFGHAQHIGKVNDEAVVASISQNCTMLMAKIAPCPINNSCSIVLASSYFKGIRIFMIHKEILHHVP